MGLIASGNLIKEIPPKNAQQQGFLLILDVVKLMTKINHHRREDKRSLF